MNLWLLIPAKPIDEGKSRLAATLSAAERARLNLRLLRHTLRVASEIRELAGVIVISRDESVLRLAEAVGAVPVSEQALERSGGATPSGTDGVTAGHTVSHAPVQRRSIDAKLNLALDQARSEAIERGADGVLVLPIDLPLVNSGAVRSLLRAALAQASGVVIAPSRDGGTNGLLLQPATLLPFSYGSDSFRRHVRLARARGVSVRTVHLPELAFDVDRPGDLIDLISAQPTVLSTSSIRKFR